MKRYYQLALLLLSGFSLLCFLFYKHEYERLRKVLEVLDIFGSSAQIPSSPTISSADFSSQESFKISPASWKTLDNGLNIYSAFVLEEGDFSTVSLLAFSKKQPKNLLSGISCYAENDKLIDNRVEGNFSWKELEISPKMKAFALSCVILKQEENPFILVLEERNKRYYFPIVKSAEMSSSLSLCVIPQNQMPYRNNFDLIEFILYYNMLGVENFYVYHNGINFNLFPQITKLVKLQNISIELISWNRPGDDDSLDFSLISNDCLKRRGSKGGKIITVKSGEYLVPKTEVSVESLLSKTKLEKVTGSQQIVFPLVSLCSNIPDMSGTDSVPLKILKRKKSSPVSNHLTFLRVNDGQQENSIVSNQTENSGVFVNFVRCPVSALDSEDQEIFDRFSKILKEMPYVKQIAN